MPQDKYNREPYRRGGSQDYGAKTSDRDSANRPERFAGRYASGSDYSYGRDNDYNELNRRRRSSYGSNQEWSPSGEAPARSYVGKGPKGYKRSDDRLKEDVSEALARHPEVDASEIEVSVKDGEVTLSGTVMDRGMKRMAEEAADRPGVRDVINQIRIKPESHSNLSS